MTFTIKLKQIDSVELANFVEDIVAGSDATIITGSGLLGTVQSIPSGVSGVDLSWSSQPQYINMTVHSSGASDPLLMGNLRKFNSTGCSFLLSDLTPSANYYLHISYPLV
jgi:hypothetical protein